MALVLEDTNEVCNSWEEIEENSDILDKQLERLKLEKSKEGYVEERQSTDVSGAGVNDMNPVKILQSNSVGIVLDSTTQESLRTQYVPPEPKMTILMRPKEPKNAHLHGTLDNKFKNTPAKTLQQREQEYAEARMRILGDVRFEAEEAEAEMEAILSPAEILKLKIAEAIRADNNLPPSVPPRTSNGVKGSSSSSSSSSGVESTSSPSDTNSASSGAAAGAGHGASSSRGRHKRSREKIKTTNPEPIRDFPVHKTDLERIIRHPRGPDGSSGFSFKRT